MKKKVLAVLMATAMAASLVGCGNSAGTETPAAETDTTDTTAAEDTATEDTAADDAAADAGAEEEEALTAKLLVWSPAEDQSEENGNWLPTMCEKFAAEHPNWDLTFEFGICPEGEAKATVTQDVEAAADVYMFANDNLTELVASNAIARLGGETEQYVKNTNSPAIVDSVSIDGAVYGVPFTTNTWFMYYDTSKITEEEANSMDAMIAKEKVAFPLSDSWYIASFYVANGCTLFGDGTDEAAGIDFGGDKAVAVTNYLVDLAANPNFVNDADGAGLAGLRDGSIAVKFSGSWDYAAIKEALGDNFGAKSLPSITIDGAEKQMMAFAGSKAIGVNPNSKNMQVAVELAKFLGSAEAQRSHYEIRNIVPCNTELLADPVIKEDALVAAQNDTFDNTAIIQPFVPAMSNYWKPAENMGKALINGDITHENAEQKTEDLNTSLNSSVVD